MASKCTTCDETITNAEFIKCDGACSRLFHSKCVAVNKTTLNVISSNSNVHWFCHDCNNSSSSNVLSSIDNLKRSVDQLTKSLAHDLSNFTNGFRTLSETLVGNITTLSNVNQVQRQRQNIEVAPPRNKRYREEESSYSNYHSMPPKRIILGTSEKDRSIAAVNTTNVRMNDSKAPSERRKSVVVSNIGSSITPEYLTNYLMNELNIEKEKIRVTPLGNNRNFNSVQYRVSAPECNYNALTTPNTWPKNVRVRDYVFKPRSAVVPMENFLERESISRAKDTISERPATIPAVIDVTPNASAATDTMANSEMEQTD